MLGLSVGDYLRPASSVICLLNYLRVVESGFQPFLQTSGLPAQNGEKAGKKGWSESSNRRAMSGAWGRNPQPPEASGCGGRTPATENFCIFYLKKAIFSAFNCIICCDNVLCIIQTQNAPMCDNHFPVAHSRLGNGGCGSLAPSRQRVFTDST